MVVVKILQWFSICGMTMAVLGLVMVLVLYLWTTRE